jgi:DNA-directed RNA polymerase sigma subunit (sigma70/sigma32)
MNKEELIEDIKNEIENLERVNKEMKCLLSKMSKEPTFVEVRAAASIMHDFYSGVEKIFERIAISVDKNLPKGDRWHIELLSQMVKPFMHRKMAVISQNLFEKLKKYLDFRHLFRHIYGFELDWDRFKNLCVELESASSEFKTEIDAFLRGLEND